jgi:hypothetical protein
VLDSNSSLEVVTAFHSKWPRPRSSEIGEDATHTERPAQRHTAFKRSTQARIAVLEEVMFAATVAPTMTTSA